MSTVITFNGRRRTAMAAKPQPRNSEPAEAALRWFAEANEYEGAFCLLARLIFSLTAERGMPGVQRLHDEHDRLHPDFKRPRTPNGPRQ